MKYLLTLRMDPGLWETLSEAEKSEVFSGHEKFQETITETGEYVGTVAFAEPGQSMTVRVRDGQATSSPGLYHEDADAFLCGYYLVDCESPQRAAEVAAQIPEAKHTAIEVLPIIHESGPSGSGVEVAASAASQGRS